MTCKDTQLGTYEVVRVSRMTGRVLKVVSRGTEIRTYSEAEAYLRGCTGSSRVTHAIRRTTAGALLCVDFWLN